jgi:hypothetical protein
MALLSTTGALDPAVCHVAAKHALFNWLQKQVWRHGLQWWSPPQQVSRC